MNDGLISFPKCFNTFLLRCSRLCHTVCRFSCSQDLLFPLDLQPTYLKAFFGPVVLEDLLVLLSSSAHRSRDPCSLEVVEDRFAHITFCPVNPCGPLDQLTLWSHCPANLVFLEVLPVLAVQD